MTDDERLDPPTSTTLTLKVSCPRCGWSSCGLDDDVKPSELWLRGCRNADGVPGRETGVAGLLYVV